MHDFLPATCEQPAKYGCFHVAKLHCWAVIKALEFFGGGLKHSQALSM